MSSKVYGVGLRNVGSYQVSGTPHIVGFDILNTQGDHEEKIEFPFVTKRIVVYHHHSATNTKKIRVTFAPTGSNANIVPNHNYFEIIGSYSMLDLDVKVKEIYIHKQNSTQTVNNIVVYAELTSIPAKSMHALTGSGITE